MIFCCLFSKAQMNMVNYTNQRNVTKLSVKSFQYNETNTVSASLSVYCHQAVHIDTSSLALKHSALQWCLSTLSHASCDVTTDAENVFSVRLRCRSRDEVDCRCWQTWNWDTDLRDTANIPWLYNTCDRRSIADMTDIPQAHWQLGEKWELQTGI